MNEAEANLIGDLADAGGKAEVIILDVSKTFTISFT